MIFFDGTWDKKGIHKPVCFSHPGASSKKQFVKLCFHKRVIQPNIEVIFQGTGRIISDFYKQAYGDDVLLFCKNKALENIRVFLEW